MGKAEVTPFTQGKLAFDGQRACIESCSIVRGQPQRVIAIIPQSPSRDVARYVAFFPDVKMYGTMCLWSIKVME